MSDQKLAYSRILVKLSGEALMGDKGFGIDMATARRFAEEIRAAAALGAKIALVVGGGNIYRGLAGAAVGMDRAKSDYMGMLATVLNALAFEQALVTAGLSAAVFSAIPMPTICRPYQRDEALAMLGAGTIVIFAAGTGNPFFTTDTAAALRAAEMGCEALLKATQVDGVYSADPHTDPNARRYDRISYEEVLAHDLKVMDGAAIALARDNKLPVIVYSSAEPGNLVNVLLGRARCTLVEESGPGDSLARPAQNLSG